MTRGLGVRRRRAGRRRNRFCIISGKKRAAERLNRALESRRFGSDFHARIIVCYQRPLSIYLIKLSVALMENNVPFLHCLPGRYSPRFYRDRLRFWSRITPGSPFSVDLREVMDWQANRRLNGTVSQGFFWCVDVALTRIVLEDGHRTAQVPISFNNVGSLHSLSYGSEFKERTGVKRLHLLN